MNARDFLPAAIVLGLAGFVAVQVATVSRPLGAAPSDSPITASAPAATDEKGAERHLSHTAPPAGGAADIRRRLAEGAPGTYIAEVVAAQDSLLVRWPDRTADPLRVWVQPVSAVRDWRSAYVAIARDAFTEWGMAGIPIRFTFVTDSGSADVRLTWTDRFDVDERIGNTRQIRDRSGWIVRGDITIAVHTVGDLVLDTATVHATSLHEVGHLLGLDHTTNPASVMTARTSEVHQLTDADRRTARLLYRFPPGSIKG